MKVKELIKFLQDYEDDMEVVTKGHDHTYYGSSITNEWAVPNGWNRFDEAESMYSTGAELVLVIE